MVDFTDDIKAIDFVKEALIGQMIVRSDTSECGIIFNVSLAYDYGWIGLKIHLENGKKFEIDFDKNLYLVDNSKKGE